MALHHYLLWELISLVGYVACGSCQRLCVLSGGPESWSLSLVGYILQASVLSRPSLVGTVSPWFHWFGLVFKPCFGTYRHGAESLEP